MKKTFVTSLIALACAALASAETGTLSNNGTTSNSLRAGYTGFDFTLSADWLTASEGLTIEPTVTLDSITLQTAATWYRDGAMGIALYEKNGSEWSFVGKSAWIADTVVGDNTFTFDSLALSSTTTYTAVFYGNEQAFSELTTSSTLSSISSPSNQLAQNPTYEAPIVAAGLHLSNGSGEALYSRDGSTSSDYLPMVSFTVTVPEPATATLSLLALADLAARRRRK